MGARVTARGSARDRTVLPRRLLALALLLGSVADVAAAWDPTGHRVVAWNTWQQLSRATRAAVEEILAAAPSDTDLRLRATGPARQQVQSGYGLFEAASLWPDTVRDPDYPERRQRYDHPTWHVVPLPWEPVEGGLPRARNDLPLPRENAIERLRAMRGVLTAAGTAAGERAIALAWLIHLVADIHQPLHCSNRITDSHPHGDDGGHAVPLAGGPDLHSYWDAALTRLQPSHPGERRWLYVRRLAHGAAARLPPRRDAARLSEWDPSGWARESLAIAQRDAYAPDLVPGGATTPRYDARALEVAEEALAVASLRLAAALEEIVGGLPSGAR